MAPMMAGNAPGIPMAPPAPVQDARQAKPAPAASDVAVMPTPPVPPGSGGGSSGTGDGAPSPVRRKRRVNHGYMQGYMQPKYGETFKSGFGDKTKSPPAFLLFSQADAPHIRAVVAGMAADVEQNCCHNVGVWS